MWESAHRELRKLDFPDCAERALQHVKQHYVREMSRDSAIPGLGGTEESSTQIVEDFIFIHNHPGGKKNKQGKLGLNRPAIQELRILQLIVKLYDNLAKEKSPETVSFSIFQALFGRAAGDKLRMASLSKLISLAVNTGSSLVLDSAALWLQLQGVQTSCVQYVIQSLISDHTSIDDSHSKLATLPILSQHFACIFISAAVSIYKYPGPVTQHPHSVFYTSLLPMMTNWILEDPQLCLISLARAQHVQNLVQPQRASLWTSPTKPNTHTPIPGLVRWETQGPLKNLGQPSQEEATSDNYKNENKLSDLHMTWSKLHLGILQIVSVFASLPGANQLELITLVDMKMMMEELVLLLPRDAQLQPGDGGDTHGHIIETSVDRMIQILQLTLSTGAFRCSLADLKQICDTLSKAGNSHSENRLKRILESQHLSNNPPAMHNAS